MWPSVPGVYCVMRYAPLLIVVLLAGCATTVKPWERGRLASPCMQVTPRLGDPFLDHVHAVRDGALSPAGIGGGCGCG